MSAELGQFRLWRQLLTGDALQVGLFGVSQQPNQRIAAIQFRYSQSYLEHPAAIALEPIHAPLGSQRLDFTTGGHDLPGFLDDCLPDAWGRRMLAWRLRLAHVDTLTLLRNLGEVTLGALRICSAEDIAAPHWLGGIALDRVLRVADDIWQGGVDALDPDDVELAFVLSRSGSSGGARPKLLVQESGSEWILKFGTLADAFDMVGAEWACLEIARRAGIPTPEARIVTLGKRRALLIRRFDISDSGLGRLHVLTANAWLKDAYSQEDAFSPRYEDIAGIIKTHGGQPEIDLEQLLAQALVNSTLHNTDDHLRNFSFVHDGAGWQLSPAYDIVPSEARGAYHQLTLGNHPYLPGLKNTVSAGKSLGLGAAASRRVAERVRNALLSWTAILDEAGIAPTERLLRGLPFNL